jgi:DNA-binding transcriptional LysR family regulator
MSIDRLRYFAAVVETRNLRQAAELVGISPPSMSKAISVLEDELGCKLIHPEGRGIGITPKGLDIYRLSSSLLEEHHRFFKRLKDSESESDKLRIASFEIFSSYFLSTFFAQEPHTDILLLEMTPGFIEQAIISGTVDIGITYLPSPDPSLEFREIGSFVKGIYGHQKWKGQSFDKWPFAIPTTELKIHSSEIDSLDMWPKKAPKRNVKYRFELLETALQTARKGLSVLHCPDFIISLHNSEVKANHQLIQLPVPMGYRTPKPVKVYLVGRKGTIPDKLERKLAKFMRSIG